LDADVIFCYTYNNRLSILPNPLWQLMLLSDKVEFKWFAFCKTLRTVGTGFKPVHFSA
jgi:hypothetical protein